MGGPVLAHDTKANRAALRLLLALSAFRLFGCTEPPSAPQRRANATENAVQREPLQPLPQSMEPDSTRVALGSKLFSDPRLSVDGSVACSNCHRLTSGGQDGRRTSVGVHGASGDINAPSVFNSGFNFVQFWDGRANTLEEQMGNPLTNPVEMGSDWTHALAFLTRDADYFALFRAAFPDGITEANVRSAIASFERTLATPNCRFDRWLRGDKLALNDTEKAGYERFKAVGCIACHQGANVGGNMFQRFGVMGEYFQDRGHIVNADYGRFNVTRAEVDRFVFRVPSLRNVELTAPYFHDGSAATLEQAVGTMAKYQLGQTLNSAGIAEIVAFLKTLTGQPPAIAPGLRKVASEEP